MQIGDTVYIYDRNRRIRTLDTDDTCWLEHTIVGQTRDSWVLSGHEAYKVDKKTLRLRVRDLYGKDHRVYTPEQRADTIWHRRHASNIVHAVVEADTATLRKIAELLGYDLA